MSDQYADLLDAADRIEQLTAERDHAWAMVEKADTQMGQSLADHLQAKAERDRLREAGSNAAKALRLIAGMDLMSASAVAFNAARELEAALKGESHE